MTTKTTALLTRLAEIGQSVAAAEGGLALLGLGSVGVERDRLDDYSDLDFFVVVEQGSKDRFLQDLDWLGRIAPLAYAFKNTDDGYKVLFVDGIFCEFAVFEPEELKNAMYTGGLWVWRRDDFVGVEEGEGKRPLSTSSTSDPQRLLGEALTNLYVGLGRFHRGEKLSAMRFIQGYAVDRVIELAALTETEQQAFPDPFAGERRVEQRFPKLAEALPSFTPGYAESVSAAQNILNFLAEHFDINSAIKAEILALCKPPLPAHKSPANEQDLLLNRGP